MRAQVRAEAQQESSVAIEAISSKNDEVVKTISAKLAKAKREHLDRLLQLRSVVKALRNQLETLRNVVQMSNFEKLAPGSQQHQWMVKIASCSEESQQKLSEEYGKSQQRL